MPKLRTNSELSESINRVVKFSLHVIGRMAIVYEVCPHCVAKQMVDELEELIEEAERNDREDTIGDCAGSA